MADRVADNSGCQRVTAQPGLAVLARLGLAGHGQAGPLHHGRYFGFVQLVVLAALQARGQTDITKTHADQAADGQAEVLEHAAHFAVTAFTDHHVVAAVGALFGTALFAAALEHRRAVFQLHALGHFLHLLAGQLAQHAHRVLAVELEAGVHHAVGQLAASGNQQQAGGVHVQTADGHPAAGFGLRQAVEHGNATFRVVTGDDLAFLLVVHDHARQAVGPLPLDRVALGGHAVVRAHLVTP